MFIFQIIVIPIWISVVFLLTAYILYAKILVPYKLTVSDSEFSELLIALNAAINTEFELWDKDVFVNKKALTNSNFDNFYHEMTDAIIRSLSPIFFKKMTQYITEEAIISIIGRKTKEYLASKITNAI